MFGRKNSKRYVLVFFIAFSLVFSPFNFESLSQSFFAEGEEIPVENIVGNVTWSENRVVSGIVTVKSGATLTIPKGVTIEFDGVSQVDVSGKLVIEGTPEQPVVLKKKDADVGDTYTVSALSSGTISIRNAVVSGGGSAYEAFMVRWPSLFQRALALWFYTGALSAVGGGTLDVEGVRFHDNALAVYTDGVSYIKTKVWRSRFFNNTLDVVNQVNNKKIDVRYNWWSNQDGPALCITECQDRPRTYEKIVGGVNFSDWATTEYFRDPVIVIPGIMGSWKWTNSSDLVLDPIAGTYDELLETFEENGYATGVNIFPFPYEWRASNVETAKLLKTKIEAVKVAAKWPKVDIVAHSMGGLIAREYIGTLNGGSNIDQLITLGTPHDGSPKSYLTWEGGEFGRRFGDLLLENIFQQEAEENGHDSFFDYVRNAPIASVRELLPVSSYLRDKDTSDMRTYPSLYPKNTFLENLKSTSNLSKITPILFSNIVGKLDSEETVTKLRVEGASIELLNNPEAVVLWGHGKPEGYDDILGGDHGMELGDGDGTVPIDSGKNIIADETLELVSRHDNLPTDGAKVVVKTLTGLDALSNEAPVYPAKSMLLFMPFSPIDIQIVAPSGKRVGKDFETGGFVNEIDGAYYTGSDTENEFVAIPRPEKGEYRILRQGTGNGEYRVEAVHLEEQADGEARESVATVTGVAVTGMEEESSVKLEETGEVVVSSNQDVTAPVTESSFQGTPGTNDWYTSDVTVTLTATDNEGGSGVEQTEYSLDNGATWNVFTEPFVVTSEGTTMLQYFSTDKAGNKETAKTETIRIDRTAPEGKIMFNSATQKIIVTGKDNLGGAVSVVMLEQSRDMVASNTKLKHIRPWFEKWWKKNRKNLPDMLATLTDEAGHTTSIAFEKWKDRKGYTFVRVKTLAYDEGESTPLGASAEFKWRTDRKNQYQQLASYLRIGAETLASRFIPKKNETWIRERTKEHEDDSFEKNEEDEMDEHERREWQKLAGLVVPYLETENGSLQAKY